MSELLMIILIIGFFYFAIRVLVTMDDRVTKKIWKEAGKNKIEIKYLREPGESDGKTPFGEIDIWFGANSNIFGVKGERVYNKIAIANENGTETRYWVKVKMTCFIPFEVEWKKLE